MQVKVSVSSHVTPTVITIIKMTSSKEVIEKKELWHTIGENAK